MFLACSEAELEFHSLKCFLTSYSPSTVFVVFRSIWGVWKWSQMISYAQKHSFGHKNDVSSMLRSWVRISLLEVLLDLLQPLQPVHGLQVDLRLLNIVSKDSLCSKHGADYVYGLLRGRVAAWSDPKPHTGVNILIFFGNYTLVTDCDLRNPTLVSKACFGPYPLIKCKTNQIWPTLKWKS